MREEKMTVIFAGTGDGRRLAELLHRHGMPVHICVATEYGERCMDTPLAEHTTVGRLSAGEMVKLLREISAARVVDATHPYAVAVSENIRRACRETGTEYLRLLRESAEQEIRKERDCVCVDSVEEAVEVLKGQPGRALVATGSKELDKFTAIPDYRERLVARVLSTPEVLAACQKLGFEGKNLIAMQGPFSEELNTALLRQIGATWLVTKESGKEGGFPEKVRAARRAGAKLLLIRRPVREEGFLLEELVRRLCPEALAEVKEPEAIPVDPRRITLLGVGMGSEGLLTCDGIRACREADVIIGAKRMLRALQSFDKPTMESFQSDEILAFIHAHPEYHRVVIALSGDVGFYSGAKKLLEGMEEDKVELICGISSVVYFCARLRMPWEDVHLLSAHGRQANLAAAIREHRKVFSLVGGGDAMNRVCRQLMDYGFGEKRIWVGQNLSYPEEQIWQGKVRELAEKPYSGLNVVLIENPEAEETVVTHGIPDEAFLRENIPMTKEEIRAVALAKLQLTRDAVVYDVGAGTGSVAVEAARQASEGLVLAIERRPQAVELIGRNARAFGVTNLEVIAGDAPEALSDLPAPTHAFLGGSGGKLAEICDALHMKNPAVRTVVTAVTLETISSLTEYLREHRLLHVDLCWLSAARARQMGEHHLLRGENPVLIAAFDDDPRTPEERFR